MAEHFKLLVPGATAAGSVDVTAPFDGAHIASIETGDSNAVEIALNNAHQLFTDKSQWLSAEQRIDVLEKAAHIMQSRFDELAVEAAREGGKPLPDSKVEVARAIDGMKNCVEVIRSEHGEEIPMGKNAASMNRLAFTTHEPIGVVVAVSAFNHPLNLAVHQVGPAIAAGCPVIIKPAEDTPLSCFRLIEILHQAGLPQAWCQGIVTTDHDAATQLVSDNRVGFFSFIGSARVGWMLRSKLAPGTRCALEHGGVAPVIVSHDADMDDTVALLSKAGFYHAGQVCVSVQRVYAEKSIARELAEKIADTGSKMKIGDPTSDDTEIGPLIRHAETDRVAEWVQDAVDKGAELIAGGEKISDSCYQATVLFNPPADATISKNEIFGPVICVYEYEDIDDAIEQANSLDVAFQAAVFSKNIDTCMHAFKQLDASAVMVNDHTAFRVDWMPFAGLKHSGHGVGGIPHTFRDMQIEKMMVIRSPSL
ncbi:MAG: aldehyde dehydrogenase family protein [Gammaproteobacteria bacterium]|nr:aldehyde dehydrogenase family protein [Gammaproteobacteria bacterium]NNJ49605.1 aldehyde dehydrogenase family protein [Gammaproteobacteria bacterium]